MKPRGSRFKIWIDAGHGLGNRTAGKTDPGATWYGKLIIAGVAELRTWWEHTLANGMANRVAKRLRDAGVDVYITNSGDYTKRAGRAWAEGCDFGVSLHFNAPVTGSGTETFIHPQASAASKELQRLLHGRLVAALGLRDRAMKQHGFAVVAGRIPACLVEVCFMGPKDLQRYQERAKKVEDALVAGLLARCGMTEKSATPAKPQTPAIEYVEVSIHARVDDVPALAAIAKEMGKAAYSKPTTAGSHKTWSGTKIN